jgi:hypothetical protein
MVAWLASGSVALLASTADSGLDLVASLITFFAVRYAAAPPDASQATILMLTSTAAVATDSRVTRRVSAVVSAGVRPWAVVIAGT